jgi:hypothetical protein
MHLRALPPPPDGVPRTVLILFLWLVPVMVFSEYNIAADDPSGHFVSRPYLRVAGAPALRYAEATPPPDLATRLPAGSPPKLEAISNPAESTPEKTPVTKAEIATDQTSAKTTNLIAVTDVAKTAEKDKPAGPPPASILPDEARPKVRPEDFLPYFTFPGNSTFDAPVAPVPGRQPPSSATYRQQ